MHTVYLQKYSGYTDKTRLKEVFEKALLSLGKGSLTGKKILIKPNFLRPSLPEKAIITHPFFLTTLMELLKEIGAKVYIGDSPGLGTLENVLGRSGLSPFIKSHGIHTADFSKSVLIKTKNPILFREFELPGIIFDVDDVINVPKLKTHQMMALTLAVKNLYGCINGLKKVKLHLTAGRNYETFAALLLDLYSIINPAINILDGIQGMEGDGPSSGSVRDFGLVAASGNAVTIDMVSAKLLGVNPDHIPYLKLAGERGLPEADEDNIKLAGIGLNRYRIAPIKLPKSYRADFALPSFLRRFAKNFLFSSPYILPTCVSCGICEKHCPAGAITLNEVAVIDKAKCIRCYCCQELCEHDAVRVKRGIW